MIKLPMKLHPHEPRKFGCPRTLTPMIKMIPQYLIILKKAVCLLLENELELPLTGKVVSWRITMLVV